MRTLFLSVTAGQGHHQAAKATIEALSEFNSESMMLDTFGYINSVLRECINKTYLLSTKSIPYVYGMIYNSLESTETNKAKASRSKLVTSILAKKLITFLQEYKPDVLVCTHIFAAQIVSYLKSTEMLKGKTIAIVTDFTIHTLWEDTCLDYYITASPQLTHQASKRGLSSEKVIPTGIPVLKKFAQKSDKSAVRRSLGIQDIQTVLVMSGSTGYGNVRDTIRRIDNIEMELQIISVCGNNKALKKKIDTMHTRKKLYNFGFVDNIDILMDASDCIVTKPGGLTVSESLAKCLPMILINPIPGQEDRNAEFLLNNGLAMKVSDRFPVDETIYQLFSDGWRRKHLLEMMREAGKPNASRDLAQLILGL